ncbi:serine hydrolase domain-containing protein, partial [Kitasatospora sp. NPDC058965]|uniref:serine hydrolase domain-containing protein n=1 Tax=Kitasatospora sp. NPDC058965 TaxID=3346682 RepID=UPI0036D019B4
MPGSLADFCTEALAAHDCPSVSVALVEGGGPVRRAAFGLADTAHRRAATPETVYKLGSVTKTFTATAVCLAADRGLLDLDAPVPGRYGDPAPTVRQLLGHRGGFGAFYAFHYGPGDSPVDPADYLVPLRPPGTGWEYANLGYYLLGRLLEQATGRPLAGYLRSEVFEPLGMVDTHVGADYAGHAPTAERYTVDGRAYPRCSTPHPGASDAWATATDVLRFAEGYRSLLRPETAAAMLDPLPIDAAMGYGLGWQVSTGPGPRVLGHGGGGGGTAAMMLTVPERGVSLAVLCNSTAKTARDAVLDRLMTELVPGSRPADYLANFAEPAEPLALPAGAWAGAVHTPKGEVPLALEVLTDGRVTVELATGARATAPAAASARWALRVQLPLQLPTPDAELAGPLLG